MRITQILTNIEIPSCIREQDVVALTARADQIGKGTLFFLTEGVGYDRHRLLPFILAKRPLAIVCSDRSIQTDTDVPILFAENARKAYAEAYFRFCGLENMKMKLVAITGTNGKTTTATMLYKILRAENIKAGFIGTGKIQMNEETLSDSFYSMTTPDPEILYPTLKKMRENGCEVAIMEASSHALALHKLAPLFFDLAVFTNLSEEHMDFHGNMEAYYLAKKRLFFTAGHAILNIDDAHARRLSEECPCTVTRVGALFEGDVTAKSIERREGDKYTYIYKTAGPTFSVRLHPIGVHQIYNSMLALCAALHLGIAPCRARRAIEALEGIDGRLERIVSDEITVYLDYAHTPEALSSALRGLKEGKAASQRLWVIFGCGGERDRLKRPQMAKIAEALSDRTILTLDNCRGESPMQILHDTVRGFKNPKSARIISNREKAIHYAVHAMADSDILLIAGKGHEGYVIDKDGYHPFDERKITLDALKERKGGHTLLYENQTETTVYRR